MGTTYLHHLYNPVTRKSGTFRQYTMRNGIKLKLRHMQRQKIIFIVVELIDTCSRVVYRRHFASRTEAIAYYNTIKSGIASKEHTQ